MFCQLYVCAYGFFIGCNMRDKSIKIPESIKHPQRYIKNKRKNKKEQKVIKNELNYLNDVIYNIENYNGTSIGQRAVKRGEIN